MSVQTARGHFFLTRIIVDLHAVVRNNTERLSLFLALVLPSELQYLTTSRTLPTSPGLQLKSKHRADGYWTPLRGCEDILRGMSFFPMASSWGRGPASTVGDTPAGCISG